MFSGTTFIFIDATVGNFYEEEFRDTVLEYCFLLL